MDASVFETTHFGVVFWGNIQLSKIAFKLFEIPDLLWVAAFGHQEKGPVFPCEKSQPN